jgi:superfamily I DNA/RNA helicase
MFKPSQYQQAIYDFAAKGTGNLIVQAVAGSGKTTTILNAMNFIKGTCLFVAFNRSIADELGRRVPAHVQASTLHSFGLKAIRQNQGFVKVDAKKLDYLCQQYPGTAFRDGMTNKEKAEIFRLRGEVKSLISISKATLIDWNNNEQVFAAATYYNIPCNPENLGAFRAIMQKSIDTRKFIDFDDMIYFPVLFNMRMPTFDNLFVDECQDLNRVQIELILKMIKQPNGRIFCVGDSKQSIYGFRGADVEAMPRLKEVLNADELPLSVCYRCPTSHVDLAKDLVPQIESAPGAVDGSVQSINDADFVSVISKENNDPLVLCRTNAPLISYCIQLIKAGKKAHVRGEDIARYIRGLIIGFQVTTHAALEDKLGQWENAQLELLCKRQASEAAKQNICDYADVIREFAKVCSSPFDIVDMIDKVFSDDSAGIVFSTVHKAKGLEADTVYILRPDQLPLIRANQQPWEVEQELNLKYVALTRSKDRLVIVNSDK